MKARILVAVICVPALLAVIFLLPAWVFGLVVGAIAAVCALEFVVTTKAASNVRVIAYALLSAFAIPVCAGFNVNMVSGPLIILALLLAMFIEALIAFGTDRQISLRRIALVCLGGGVIPLMLSGLATLRAIPEGLAWGDAGYFYDGKFYVLIPLIIAFITDGGAFFVGSAFGHTKLIEKISPNKTWEGSIGGLLTATASMMIYGLIMVMAFDASVNLVMVVVYAVVGSVITQIGDLSFSMIKREYDKKDFGNLLPGHGGMLDRFDSMILLTPFICALVLWLPVFVQ